MSGRRPTRIEKVHKLPENHLPVRTPLSLEFGVVPRKGRDTVMEEKLDPLLILGSRPQDDLRG